MAITIVQLIPAQPGMYRILDKNDNHVELVVMWVHYYVTLVADIKNYVRGFTGAELACGNLDEYLRQQEQPVFIYTTKYPDSAKVIR